MPYAPSVLRAFEESDVPAAGRLLAARHAEHRRTQPGLSAQYEQPDLAARQIAAVLATDEGSGAVAYDGDELTGYVVGSSKDSSVWGPNVWVEAAGIAVRDAEQARDLYAYAARAWVEQGRTAHYAVLPAHDPALLDAWYRLGFGQQHAHAIRSTSGAQAFGTRADILVRRAERADIPVLARLELVLPDHQAGAPVFSAGPTPTLEETIAEWETDIDDEEYAGFVAVRDGDVVGSALGCDISKSGIHVGLSRPDHAGFLGFAAVLPPARGLGVGRTLGERVIAWAAQEGYDEIVTDWRVTNLLSSRTWPRLGFIATFVRVHRVVGY